jgi:hypothetical protein
MKRTIFASSIAVLLAALGCSVTTTSPPPSGSDGSKTQCKQLLACCGALPADQVAACQAKANDPNISDFDCYGEIIQHYTDGYCDANGNPLDGGAAAPDGGASTDAADATFPDAPPPPPESQCHTLAQEACGQCCLANHTVCQHAVRVADQGCSCTPSACGSVCAATYCSNPDNVPTSGACSDCLENAILGPCANAAEGVLSSNADCTAEMACVQGCPTH